jgi:hypothetical protein
MPRMGHDSRKETLPGVRSHRRHVLQLSASTRGFENLSTDYHDKAQRSAIDTPAGGGGGGGPHGAWLVDAH